MSRVAVPKTMKNERKSKIAEDLKTHLADMNISKVQFYQDCDLSEFLITKMLKDVNDQQVSDDAWMSIEHFLETGKKYTGFPVDRKKEISLLITDFLNTRDDISQNKLATMIGVSTAVISNAINKQKFSERRLISNDMWRKIESYFDAPKSDHWDLFKTTNYLEIFKLCKDAQEHSRFLSCIGDTGLGKTATFKEYARITPNTFYVLCESVHTQKEFLWEITKAIGITVSGSCSNIINAITAKLIQTDKPLLILDDAGKLSDSNLSMIQLLYDKTDGHTRQAGLIIAGMPHLKMYIEKGVQLGKRGFAELHRRVGYWLPLIVPSKLIIQQLCNHHGIDDKDVIKYVYRIATNYGTLKELVTNLKRISKDGVTMEAIADVNVGDDVESYV